MDVDPDKFLNIFDWILGSWQAHAIILIAAMVGGVVAMILLNMKAEGKI